MINTNEFKTGQTIKLNNNIYQIIDFLHVKPGKGSAFVRTKLKNLKNGEIIDYVFNSGIKIEKALVLKKKMQFSYVINDKYFFLDLNNFEPLEIEKNKIKNIVQYLKQDMLIDIMFDEERNILDLIVPEKISFKVIQTEPANFFVSVKKNTSLKDAVLETGLVIKVPLFIENNENIIVNTQTGLYYSRDTSK
ncbi:MAG: elongation factor P [Vigna little leaf phytoplasma]|nr:elongation factor P [Vigna little leaf phytoplasma]